MSTILETAPTAEQSSQWERPIVPPLENGDRLTRAEFYRRWETMPEVTRAERIEGVVHMAAAVRFKQHGGPHSSFVGWIVHYRTYTPGTETGDNTTLQIDLDNDPQPDVFLRITAECGGQSNINDEGYVTGAPEWIGEVAASSVGIDMHSKLDVYRRSGVQEYVVWKVLEKEIAWFHSRDGEFVEKLPDDDGVFRSERFPGLWLDEASLVADDLRKVFEVLGQGLRTEAHAEFTERLAAQRDSSNT